jgi:hypothetical protein
VITGWPYAPGSHTVKVSASDTFGGTGSASFTWTIGASGNTGTVGRVQQAGGTGKCLNDPQAATANGTLLNLWTCGTQVNEKMTFVQDGTIRVQGKCLTEAGATSGSGVVIGACSGTAAQWRLVSAGRIAFRVYPKGVPGLPEVQRELVRPVDADGEAPGDLASDARGLQLAGEHGQRFAEFGAG